MTNADSADDKQAGDAGDEGRGDLVTEQEAIAGLGGTAVPGRSGFTFQGAPRKDGEAFYLKVIQDSTGTSVGSARGSTSAEIIAHAQELAEEFSDD